MLTDNSSSTMNMMAAAALANSNALQQQYLALSAQLSSAQTSPMTTSTVPSNPLLSASQSNLAQLLALQQQLQQQQSLSMSLPSTPQGSAFEGLPIYLVPGASTLPALSKEMKVSWATQRHSAPDMPQGPKIDTSKHFHIFVGDLSPEVDNPALTDAFKAFGEVSEAKVIRDPATLKSKGYGFVAYVKKEDAERAIDQMNGAWLGRRAIRTNWASRRGQAQKQQSYDEVYNQTGPTNATVYLGNIGQAVTEEDIRMPFSKYGNIVEVRIFKQQGYAFIRFDTKDSACQSIVNLNNSEIAGQTVRASWGRAADQGGQQGNNGAYGYGYGSGSAPGGGYGGPQGYGGGYGAPGGPQAALAQQQAQQYWQQYYQYYSNPQIMQQWQQYWQQNGGNASGPQ